jgi:serine/threonine-protein kinase HipA
VKAQQTLRVLLHGVEVAQLRATPALELRYAPDVVASSGVGALSLSAALPVAAKPYKDSKPGTPRPRRSVEHWAEGLLPEGETRTMLEQRFRVRRGDTIGLLAAIGADCAGAVTFAGPVATAGRPADGADAPAPLSEVELAAAVEALPSVPLGVGDRVRVSLGGMKAKLLRVHTPGGLPHPLDGQPSTHILKPDPRDLTRAGLVAAEALTLRAAALAGIAAAGVELTSIDSRLVLIVERYDRHRQPDGTVVRLHQEDGCQALGLDPALSRYQRSASEPPSYAELARLLRTHAAHVDAELVALAQQMILGWAVGNNDGHARNFSFLLSGGTARLAPAYDVAPTHLFASSRDSGLWIDGQSRMNWITKDHLIREMCGWGIEAPVAERQLDDTLGALSAALPRAAAELGPLLDAELLDDTLTHVIRRATSAA